MTTVTSKDGTRIAYSARGEGPPLVLVDGAFGHRAFGPNASLAAALEQDYTVYHYDRRGRGDSGDAESFSTEREHEDLEAVMAATGGPAYVYGISSGAALVLDAVDKGVPARKIAVFEAPFVVDDSRPAIPADLVPRMQEMLAQGRRSEVVRAFMTQGVGLPGVFVSFMRLLPSWKQLTSLAHTAPYDLEAIGTAASGTPLDPQRWSGVKPPTLVLDGGKSPAWMRHAMRALSESLPDARYETLPGQMHVVKAGALAPVLRRFLTD
jgi:pimeloyl-ACP methyl ester carboxylesterase